MRTIHLPVAEPCHERWDAMEPEARGRFCQVCTKSVHDVSSMTEGETRALLRANAGRTICVRYSHDASGNVRHRRSAALAMVAVVAMAACTPHDDPKQGDPIANVPGRRVDLDRVIDIDLAPPGDDREIVGEMMPVDQIPPPLVEPPKPIEVEPPPTDATNVRMGMMAVRHEPCDPPVADGTKDELPQWNEGMR